MDKIYRRGTQSKGHQKKKKNEKNRIRNTIINFRVTPEEKELIDARIAVTGLTKADFFIESCLHQSLHVNGNIKSFTIIKKKVEEIAAVIKQDPRLENMDPVHAESLRTILEILQTMFGKE